MTDPRDQPLRSAGASPSASTPEVDLSGTTADHGSAPSPVPPEPGPAQTAPGFDQKGKVSGGRVSGVWIALIATAIFLILLIIFIAQNSHRTTIHFLGWDGRFSIGLAILLSAVIGMLLVALPGSIRILQLRRALRKNVPGGKRR